MVRGSCHLALVVAATLGLVAVGCGGAVRAAPGADTRPTAPSGEATPAAAPPAPTDLAIAEPTRQRSEAGPPVVLWEHTVPLVTSLGGGRDRVFVFAGNDITALERAGGGIAWTYVAPPLRPTARVLGCACAAGAGVRGGDLYTVEGGDTVVALDPATGATRWSRKVGDAVASAPLSQGSAVLVVAADGEGFFAAALEKATGAPRWESRPPAPVLPVLVPAGQLVLAPLADGGAIAFGTEGGQVAWTASDPTARDIFLPWQVGTDLLLLRTSDGLRALDRMTGTPLWRVGLADWPMAAIAGGDHVYVKTDPAHLVALDARSGERRWSIDLAPGFYSDAVLPTDRALYVLTRAGRLVALDPVSGQIRWEEQFGAGMGAPTIVAGRLALATLDGDVHVLDTETGERKGSVSVPGSVFLSPVESLGELFVVAEHESGTTIVAIGWEDGPTAAPEPRTARLGRTNDFKRT